jgi:hypothetical protein
MKFPKGKGFDIAGGLVITVVLDDITLIGRFLGEIEERYSHDDDPLIVNVKVDNDPEFILLQLVCDVEGDDGPEIEAGTVVAVNVNKIQLIAPGGECEDD